MIVTIVKLIQYADDTFLNSSHNNENIARSYLEKNIEKLCYNFQSHQLMMNNKKTEYIVFAPSKKARNPSHLKVNDVNKGESSSVRYLGIILDNKLNFKRSKEYSPEWRAASKS